MENQRIKDLEELTELTEDMYIAVTDDFDSDEQMVVAFVNGKREQIVDDQNELVLGKGNAVSNPNDSISFKANVSLLKGGT